MSEEDVLRSRREKLAALREAGVDPYPARVPRTHACSDAHDNCDRYADGGATVAVAGRVVGFRGHGKTAFVDLSDESGKVQVYLRRDDLGQQLYELLKLADLGDFMWASGTMMRTRAGEPTLKAARAGIAVKSLAPTPEKHHGLSDVETRSRRRELDLVANHESRDVFSARSNVVRATREYLWSQGYREVETPVMQPVYGGAHARPFTTHHHVLDFDFFLRISLEIYLKRLLVGGFERVFEIGKVFRNEGMDRGHSPEFTLLEAYAAFSDYRSMMRLSEGIVLAAIGALDGNLKRMVDGREVDFTPPWAERTMRELLLERAALDVLSASDEELRDAAKARGVETAGKLARGKLIDELFKATAEPHLWQPTFVTGHPVEVSPLAKRDPENPALVERFELFIAGAELVNAFTENNDAVDQRARLEEQARARVASDDEVPPVDEAFVSALEVGMPPAGGMGMGIDRLVMLLTDRRNIRDVILFPHMRPEGR